VKTIPSFILQLPYPDSILSPNSPKRHWRLKQPAKEAARDEAFLKSSPFRSTFAGIRKLKITLTFFPPSNVRRDLDNAFASMKSSIDGMCKGLGIDDSQIRKVTLEWGAVVKGGAVELELKQYGGK
jgi:crossover junction endodeoxyribonuclease RusA